MKLSYFNNINKNHDSFSCQGQSFSERMLRSEIPQRSEDNFQEALLFEKEITI